jgi:hypothetical protein
MNTRRKQWPEELCATVSSRSSVALQKVGIKLNMPLRVIVRWAGNLPPLTALGRRVPGTTDIVPAIRGDKLRTSTGPECSTGRRALHVPLADRVASAVSGVAGLYLRCGDFIRASRLRIDLGDCHTTHKQGCEDQSSAASVRVCECASVRVCECAIEYLHFV